MKSFLEKFRFVNQNMSNVAKISLAFIVAFVFAALVGKFMKNPFIIIMIISLLLAIIPHEIAHGLAAYAFGDKTAYNAGRLTLNPIKHIDPMGIIAPIIMILAGIPFVFGWAKPVPVNFYRIKDKKLGLFSVAIAGVMTNFILAAIYTLILKFAINKDIAIIAFNSVFRNEFHFKLLLNIEFLIAIFIIFSININIVLGIFNLIPIPPLDGSRVIESFGIRSINSFFKKIERFGFIILLILLVAGIIDILIFPIIHDVISVVYKFILN